MWLRIWVEPEDILIDEEVEQAYVPVELPSALEALARTKKAARAATRAAITLKLVK